jgi:NAD(P)-dependent dehydrogenase (short-subunit alcohol dehydrogenase family)
MVNRKEKQGQEAIEKIKSEKADAQIEWVPCDLGHLSEVKSVFTGLRERLDRLDLLICSAGINANKFDLDADGIDRHFGVNWLGHYYAINLLYPLLRKTSQMPDTPPPRIVFESSEMHRFAPNNVHFASKEEINDDSVGPAELYARTKLAMILGCKYGLLERVIKPNNDRIYTLCVHPGTVNTDMQEQWKDAYPGLTGKLLTSAMYFVGRSPEQGSFSALYAATSPEVEERGWNGVYLSDPGQLGKETAQASDPALGESLWRLSEQLVQGVLGAEALEDWNRVL